MSDLPPIKKTLRGAAATALKPKFVAPKVDFESGGKGAEVFYQMHGIDALVQNIGMLPKFYQDVAGYEAANIAADVITDARDNYVPYKDGALRDSGNSDEYQPAMNMQITEIGMWFGGPAALGMGSTGRQIGKSTKAAEATQMGLHTIDPTIYAAVQHEDPDYKHPILGPVSAPQWKYLETPLNKMIPNILPRIAKAIEEAGGSL